MYFSILYFMFLCFCVFRNAPVLINTSTILLKMIYCFQQNFISTRIALLSPKLTKLMVSQGTLDYCFWCSTHCYKTEHILNCILVIINKSTIILSIIYCIQIELYPKLSTLIALLSLNLTKLMVSQNTGLLLLVLHSSL